MAAAPLYIGVMTGTSIDGLDLAAIRVATDKTTNAIAGESIQIIGCASYDLPAALQTAIRQIARSQLLSWASFGEVDATLGSFTGECINRFMAELNITAQEVAAVGSHGQTVHHSPDSSPAFTVQLGDATRIAAVTGLKVIADFRRADMALGGQGAPLVPPFHQRLFGKNDKNVALCNIGGIANLTLLPTGGHNAILGFDTGPGNTLLDAWCARHTGNSFDKDGAWAATGQCHPGLLQALMSDPFLQREPPKSTGVEHYNLTWLDARLSEHNLADLNAADVQATLIEFTAQSITHALHASPIGASELVLCGGGRKNSLLVEALQKHADSAVRNCDELGIDGDGLEAAAFAWLAHRCVNQLPGNEPSVTGARGFAILGATHHPPSP